MGLRLQAAQWLLQISMTQWRTNMCSTSAAAFLSEMQLSERDAVPEPSSSLGLSNAARKQFIIDVVKSGTCKN